MTPSEAMSLRELARTTAASVRGAARIPTTNFGDGRGNTIKVWNLNISFNQFKEEVYYGGTKGFRESYKYDQLLLAPDGYFRIRNCYGETTQRGQTGGFYFYNDAEMDLLTNSDLNPSDVIAALQRLTG